jgi:PKD repeat protein
MKKIHYTITLFLLLVAILYQPAKNIYFENKRVQNEIYLQEYLSDKSFKRSYVKSLPKRLRPDLKNYHDFLMTRDPNTNSVPSEKVLDAIKFRDAKLNSRSYLDRKSEINWTERGPSKQAGRTRALMLDGNFNSNTKVWAAGVSGGLWTITNISNASSEWTKVSDFWDTLNITCVATDPTDANVIYLGTGEKRGHGLKGFGIWKTSDGGSTWNQLTSSTDLKWIDTIIVRDEGGVGVVYAGGGRSLSEGEYTGVNGLQKSTDGGATWTEVLGEISAGSSHHVTDLELDSNNRLIVGTRTNTFGEGGGQIFYSDDGVIFSQINTNALGTFDRTFVDVSPSDPNVLYAMFENANTGFITWLGKSEDGGDTWTQKTIGVDENGNPFGDYQGSMDYWGFLGIDPNNPNTIFAAGAQSIHKSTDSGETWTEISEWRGTGFSLPYVHADHHNIVFIDSDKIIVSNDGGVFLTTDGGSTFTMKNDNMVTTQFYSTAIHPTDSDYVLGGTQDNGTWKLNTAGKDAGVEVYGGDGGFAHIDQVNPDYQFGATLYGNIFRSVNGGRSFSVYSNVTNADGTDAGFFINPSVIDGVNKAMYATFDTASILRIKDYTLISDHDFININLGSGATAYKVSPHTSGLLYVGTASGRVFKITDAHTDNYTVTEISPSNTTGYISSIDVGANDDQILITLSNYGINSIYETISGGGSNAWVNIEGDLPDIPVRWGLYNRNNFNQVAVATEVGVWVSDDVTSSSITWNPSNDGLANVRVDMLAMNSDGEMSAGTFGRGQFTSPGFTSTAPLNAAFSPSKTYGAFPLEVNFIDRSTGNASSWSWDFGDGNTSTLQSPTHTFTAAGRYTVSLTVSDGTNSSVTTKTNLIWATSQQDNLWGEGFEVWPYGDTNGARDTRSFSFINANGDSDDTSEFTFGWWYYNNGQNAAENSRRMVGQGDYATETVRDDWLITPELWLRPGTDNTLSFYHQVVNGQTETFDVVLSPSGGSDISDFTETLGSISSAQPLWEQSSYDLSQWAGTKVRVAIHSNTATGPSYVFWDSFRLTAGVLSADGAPLPPQGLKVERELVYDDASETWSPTDDGVAIFWNRNGEPDLASYNVYASQTDNFDPNSNTLLGEGTLGDTLFAQFSPAFSADGVTNVWEDSTFYYPNTVGIDSLLHDGLAQGETWYYRVGAVDNDGNETLSEQVSYAIDTVAPTAGTITVNNLVDGYLKSLTELNVSVDGFSDDLGISQYYFAIGDGTQVFGQRFFDVGENLTLTGLSLPDKTVLTAVVNALDGSGNASDPVTQEVTTYVSLLGDYDSDNDVDVEDLNAFTNAWPNSGFDASVDLGPASGTAPYLIPTLDQINNIYDISTFSRMWLWTKSQSRTPIDIEIMPIEFEAEILSNQIIIELPEGVTAGRFQVGNSNNTYNFNTEQKEGYIILENNDELNQYYELEFGNLSSNDRKFVINIEAEALSSNIEFNYQLYSKDGIIGNGMMQLRNPDEFHLYQNYPNPFNNQTTIMYDIPSLMVNIVDVEILIYNTVGTLVRTLDEGDKGAGQHTTLWDGRNDDGEKVSSGVYFYQLRAKVDGQSDYNKTKKMVIVR